MTELLFMTDTLNGGGAERVLINILRRLDYTRYHVTLFLIYGEGIYLEALPEQVTVRWLAKSNLTVKSWPPVKRFAYKLYRKLLFAYVRALRGRPLYRRMPRKEFDIEISFLEGETCYFIAHSGNSHSRKLAWIHSNLEKRRALTYEKELQALSAMDRILCVSKGAEAAVLRLYPGLAGKTQVVYNPIDKEEIMRQSQEMSIPGYSGVTIVCVGRLISVKGYDVLLKAHCELLEEGIAHRILVLGEGVLEQELRAEIKRKNAEESFLLLGFQSNPYAYVKAADIFVLPSRSEGFSLALAEAMILGKPVIATRCAGPEEILEERFGLLVPPDDAGALQSAMRKLILDGELRDFYAHKALERAEMFDIDTIMADINTLLTV